MTLLDLYEDLFQYLCRINRASKAQAQPSYERVRGDLIELLDRPAQTAAGDVRLLNQVQALELPMVFFVDSMICASQLPFNQRWADNRLAVTLKNQQAGDERWFEFLENDLHDPSDDARERLAIYYTCLGVGFMGMYVGSPGKLIEYMNQIFPRIGPFMKKNPTARLTEEAYKHTNTTILTEEPSKWIVVVLVVFVFLVCSALALYSGLYVKASNRANEFVKTTLQNSTNSPAK